ncbi:thiamine-phosphate kinase [Calidifontibacter sp. DB0510]|uniref:Thiamine-monophosphate kinase n=1 Tax=Metallococcus carri TaxID=1656884 RepID=A0A967AXX0_9MICO|nr:thiamine-phosphate kinase [Metallococcus carri]NHN54472.1 thiamine-phosphate kinase [Metallococcus carri]NOP36689.1 thiamine-phosphate kinase [Calidifontibacter sp. DB2511S]
MTTLAQLSEEQILARILPHFAASSDVLLAPGDDAAVLRASGAVVVTTDSMVRGLDWRDDWSSASDVGRKVVVQNVADIAAMGARCTGLVVALAAAPATEIAWLEELATGIAAAAAEAGTSVVGGDLSSAPAGVVVITLTALGDLGGRAPVLRSGARVGDVVAVCGSLGRSGAGLALYADAADRPEQSAAAAVLREAHRTAGRPPYEAGPAAADAGATAMLDISDGLVRDAGRIAAASGVGIALDRAALEREVDGPIREVFGADGLPFVLTGGEEHSLLATFPPGGVPSAEPSWRAIGEVTAGTGVSLDGIPQTGGGWDHFAQRKSRPEGRLSR